MFFNFSFCFSDQGGRLSMAVVGEQGNVTVQQMQDGFPNRWAIFHVIFISSATLNFCKWGFDELIIEDDFINKTDLTLQMWILPFRIPGDLHFKRRATEI